ncbi:hypothetical protein POF50_000155 [Streptomyces sp. SL13]|jgi:hypothetical protein|uniref:DUF1453 domain-containing protein n=1 Tax=Streptantibioticus silvisoli TaxID=2705255 RepID=A0AA90GYR9_9ACTN|nr:hypothetical protein [Streptantibioticus silvisoli]MDI5963378.1 hypothetical protein [Streptantibioticus silvisoli]MDI5967778.1 hypothetical protein [Streptantibioticus silvisoli]
MSEPLEIVLILAAICYVMLRRMMGEPAQAKQMLVLPLVLGGIGLSDVSGQVATPTSAVFLVATAGISVVFGVLRGMTVRLAERDGVAFVRYTGLTVALWIANLLVKFGANAALKALDAKDAGALGNSLLLTLGAGMLVEGLVVLYRALRSDHQVMWSNKDDAPRRMSPFLDGLRDSLNGRDAAGNPSAEPYRYGDRRDGVHSVVSHLGNSLRDERR